MALPVVSQPNNVPSLAPTVAPAPLNQPNFAPSVQAAPATPQPTQIPVQPAPPQQQNLSVTQSQPQQQNLSVQLPPIVTAIQTALNRGADPTAILQQITQQNPSQAAAIQTALSRGASPQQILTEIINQNSGISSSSPQVSQQHVGFIQSLVQSLTHWATAGIGVPLYDAGAAAGDLLKGDTQAAQTDIAKPRDLGYFGTVAPVELDSKHLGKTAAQLTGLAAQGASLGIPNPVTAGAVFGAGDALSNNKGVAGTLEEAGLGALGGKLGDLAVSGISKTLSSLLTEDGASGNIINSLIKPLQKEFRFGKNPGLGVAQEKLIASSLPDLEKQISTRLSEIGGQIGQKVSSAPALNTADYSAVLKPFDDAIQQAAEGGPNNQLLITRLNNTKDALQYEMEVRQGNVVPKLNAATNAPVSAGLEDLTAQEGNALKQKIGGFRKWTGNPSEDTVYNQAVSDAYRTANNIVESQAPGIKALNSRYANLLSAQSSIERLTAVQARGNLLSTFDKVGLGAAGLSLLHGDIKTAAVELASGLTLKTLGSTAVKTRVAAALSSVPDLAGQLFEANPALKTLLQTTGQAATTTGRYIGSRFGARLGANAASSLTP